MKAKIHKNTLILALELLFNSNKEHLFFEFDEHRQLVNIDVAGDHSYSIIDNMEVVEHSQGFYPYGDIFDDNNLEIINETES